MYKVKSTTERSESVVKNERISENDRARVRKNAILNY